MDIELIGADNIKKILDTGDVYLIDVRKQKEYEKKHIKGAVNIPLEDIEAIENGNVQLIRRLGRILKADKRIILYCKTGTRSMRGAKILGEYGIKCASIYGLSQDEI